MVVGKIRWKDAIIIVSFKIMLCAGVPVNIKLVSCEFFVLKLIALILMNLVPFLVSGRGV